jgi:hypothetical protein
MTNINPAWAETQASMSASYKTEGPHASLAAGEVFAATLHPMRAEGFRLRDVVFRHLHQHRMNHSITFVSHLQWAAARRWDEGHPLRTVLEYNVKLATTEEPDERARLLASRAKVMFAMGWVTEADQAYHKALEISECPPARLGRAAVLRHRMYQLPKGLMRRDLWGQAMELVEEANDIEESAVGAQLLDSLKGDERWL